MVTQWELIGSSEWAPVKDVVLKDQALKSAVFKNINNLPLFSDDFDRLGPKKVAEAINQYGPEMTAALDKGDITAFKEILQKSELGGMPNELAAGHEPATVHGPETNVMDCHPSETDAAVPDAAAADAVNSAVAQAEAERNAENSSITNSVVNATEAIAGTEAASAVNTAMQSGQGIFADIQNMFTSGNFNMSNMMGSVMGFVNTLISVFSALAGSVMNGDFKLDGMGKVFSAFTQSMGANPTVENTAPAPEAPAATADQTLQQTQQPVASVSNLQPATPGLTG